MGKKNRHYVYANAGWSSHGLMMCSCCGKKITQGEYRYYETPDAFVTQHRACCPDDLQWAKNDQVEQQRAARNQNMLADATAFRNKWGITDLDELIEALS